MRGKGEREKGLSGNIKQHTNATKEAWGIRLTRKLHHLALADWESRESINPFCLTSLPQIRILQRSINGLIVPQSVILLRGIERDPLCSDNVSEKVGVLITREKPGGSSFTLGHENAFSDFTTIGATHLDVAWSLQMKKACLGSHSPALFEVLRYLLEITYLWTSLLFQINAPS